MVHVQESERTFRQQFSVVWRELGDVVIQIEAPDVSIGLVGVGPQRRLDGGVEREKGGRGMGKIREGGEEGERKKLTSTQKRRKKSCQDTNKKPTNIT